MISVPQRPRRVVGDAGDVERAADPVGFWSRLARDVVLGGLALAYAGLRDA